MGLAATGKYKRWCSGVLMVIEKPVEYYNLRRTREQLEYVQISYTLGKNIKIIK